MEHSVVAQKEKGLVCHLGRGGERGHTHRAGRGGCDTDERGVRVLKTHFLVLSFPSCWLSA